MHEASLFEQNSYITLTYSPENLPPGGTLVKKHFQDFMKRLRKHFAPRRIRFYACGEYGSKLQRPHYHACLFNLWFEDAVHFKGTGDKKLYISDTLAEVWGKGHASIGAVTFDSAAYVARYIMKKITGDGSHDYYWKVDQATGEAVQVEPEFTLMSRRPGIGAEWVRQYLGETYPSDEVICRGRDMRPPRFYDEVLKVEDPEEFERLKRSRRESATERTDAELYARERNIEARLAIKRTELDDNEDETFRGL